MRAPSAATLGSLLGSLGLHGCAVLILLLMARVRPAPPVAPRELPDAWQGNAVEVETLAAQNDASPAHAESAAVSAESVPARSEPSAIQPDEPTTRLPRAVPKAPPQPARRPRASAPREPTSSDASSARPAHVSAATGAFGSEGLPLGVRSLPSAFTRAIPPASGADPIWQSLPIGTQRSFVLAVEVDAAGHIGEARIVPPRDGSPVPPQFEHLRQRVIALLGGGLFALRNDSTAGRDLFRITITLSDRAVHDESAPAELVERGFDPPRGSTPGRAYFTLASGRHFEAQVEVLSAAPRAHRP